jgi:hypothetical protein
MNAPQKDEPIDLPTFLATCERVRTMGLSPTDAIVRLITLKDTERVLIQCQEKRKLKYSRTKTFTLHLPRHMDLLDRVHLQLLPYEIKKITLVEVKSCLEVPLVTNAASVKTVITLRTCKFDETTNSVQLLDNTMLPVCSMPFTHLALVIEPAELRFDPKGDILTQAFIEGYTAHTTLRDMLVTRSIAPIQLSPDYWISSVTEDNGRYNTITSKPIINLRTVDEPPTKCHELESSTTPVCPLCFSTKLLVCDCEQEDRTCCVCGAEWHSCPVTHKLVFAPKGKPKEQHIECKDCDCDHLVNEEDEADICVNQS